MRQRLGRIRQKLQQLAADNTALVHHYASRDNMPLSKILMEFQRQSGNMIVDQRGKRGDGEPKVPSPTLKVNFNKTPFWQALDQLADQAELGVSPFTEKAAISLTTLPNGGILLLNGTLPTARVPRVGRACYSGPFRFEVASVVARRDFRPLPRRALSVNVEIAWEPRLRIIGLTRRMADVKAVDGRGNPLPVADDKAQLEIPTSGDAAAVELNLPLQLPSRDVRRVASLKGRLLAMIPGRIETFRFDNPAKAKNVEKRIAGVTVTLEGVSKNNDVWEMRVLVNFDNAGDALASRPHLDFQQRRPPGRPRRQGDRLRLLETDRAGEERGRRRLLLQHRPAARQAQTFVYKTPGTIVNSGSITN